MSVYFEGKLVQPGQIEKFPSFTLVDKLHTLTFLSILVTLIVSAVALKLHDNQKTALALKISRNCAVIVVVLYIVLNVIFISAAISSQ